MKELLEQSSQTIFPPDTDDKPTSACHAASVVETSSGLFAAWFAGSKEGKKDVCIWGVHYSNKQWREKFLISKGYNSKGAPEPCWNPVLIKQSNNKLILFFKVGPSPRKWWGMSCTSSDNGKSWSCAENLPKGFFGPIKNKPLWINDRLVCPSSTETNGWQVHFELYEQGSHTKTEAKDPNNLQAIQPALLQHNNNTLQALCRTRRKKIIATCFSYDNGRTWSPLQETTLPNPNSGIDAITLHDRRHLLVYNHATKGRTPLNIALSNDGIKWSNVATLEQSKGEYSYPAVIQSSDGLIHILYTWRRLSIRHRIFKPQ